MNVTLPVHVSIISDYGIELQPSQVSGLKKALAKIHSSHSGRVVLHHGCSTQADVIAHSLARGAGWRIEGHPARAAVGVVPWQAAAIRDQLETIHPARRHDDRDLDLIWASNVIVAVESDSTGTSTLVSQAAAAGWDVAYVRAAKLSVVPAQCYPRAAMSLPVHDLTEIWR